MLLSPILHSRREMGGRRLARTAFRHPNPHERRLIFSTFNVHLGRIGSPGGWGVGGEDVPVW